MSSHLMQFACAVVRSFVVLAFVALGVAMLAPQRLAAATITGDTGPGGLLRTDVSSELRIWLKADAISQGNATPVASWNDSSFFNNDATAMASPDRRPLFTTGGPNGNPTVRFDGANDYMSTPFVASRGTFFVVFADRVDGTYGLLDHQNVAFLSTTAGLRPGVEGSQSEYAETHAANVFRIAAGTTTGTAPFAITRNGVAMAGPASTGSTAFSAAGMNIGARVGTNSLFFDGDIAEIAVFNRAATSSERIIVENSLSAKYDVTLGANNQYTGDDLAQGHYDRDVFGIGRVGTGNEVTTAGAAGFGIESSTTLDNGDWAFAGHKTVNNGLTSADVEPNSFRWERSWFVDVTNVVDARLAFDWDDAGIGGLFDAEYTQLFYRANETSDFQSLNIAGSYIGQKIEFLVSGLQDGYYTLGTASVAAIPEPTTVTLLAAGCLALGTIRRRRLGR